MVEYSVACQRCHHGWTTQAEVRPTPPRCACGEVTKITGAFHVVPLTKE